MIVIDTSAVIAILTSEPTARRLATRINGERERVMSVASYLEAGTVMASRRGSDRSRAIIFLDAFLADTRIELRPVDEQQARIALDARIRYGRGMGHGGKLNYGDTFSYALAKSLDAPLLYIGQDFAMTDITSALG